LPGPLPPASRCGSGRFSQVSVSPSQRTKFPTELYAIIAKNPKGIAVGKISAALPGYPLSSIRKALKDLIKAKAIKMEGKKALAVYKPMK